MRLWVKAFREGIILRQRPSISIGGFRQCGLGFIGLSLERRQFAVMRFEVIDFIAASFIFEVFGNERQVWRSGLLFLFAGSLIFIFRPGLRISLFRGQNCAPR